MEFKVNDVKQNHAMKLGDGGEAFFVFETSEQIPESLQTSPVVSPTTSPQGLAQDTTTHHSLQEPDFLDINADGRSDHVTGNKRLLPLRPGLSVNQRAQSDYMIPSGRFNQANNVAVSDGSLTPPLSSPGEPESPPPDTITTTTTMLPEGHLKRSASADLLPLSARFEGVEFNGSNGTPTTSRQDHPQVLLEDHTPRDARRSNSPPPLSTADAVGWAKSLSKKLSISNIPTRVTESGDLMLDMNGYKTSEDEALRAEGVARKLLAEELEGNYDIGALIGADTNGNLWIYSSEEAKEAAQEQIRLHGLTPPAITSDVASDPGYHSDDNSLLAVSPAPKKHQRTRSEASPADLTVSPSQTPLENTLSSGDPNRNYAKTLRLTSEQLRSLDLRPGPNTMSFSVNRATCSASMYFWTYDVPIVISDIDGTITK